MIDDDAVAPLHGPLADPQRRAEHQARVAKARAEIGDIDEALKRLSESLGEEGRRVVSEWLDERLGPEHEVLP